MFGIPASTLEDKLDTEIYLVLLLVKILFIVI